MDTFFLLALAVSNGALASLGVATWLRRNREWPPAVLAAAGASTVFQAWLCWGPPVWLMPWLAVASAVAAWTMVAASYKKTRGNGAIEALSTAEDSSNPWGLSERELEIGRSLGKGLIGKEIAYELRIRPVTIKNHLYNMYRKTGARGRVELLNLLRERGLL